MEKFLMAGVQTERLQFRKVSKADFPAWLPFWEDPESTRYWAGLPAAPPDACKEQFQRIFERYELGLGGMNALVNKESGELVGLCGLLVQQVDQEEALEIGYSILPRFRRQGYASEAAQACKIRAFTQGWATSLISIIHVDNLTSQQVAKNNGMRLDKATIYKDNPVYIYRVRTS